MITVLPTHAPPKSHTFHPLSIGAMRSITLIPVSKSSALFERSWKSGDFLWIGSIYFAFGAGFSSIGSPSTLNILPSTPSQTGTCIGDPEASTSSHLFTPSTAFIAIVLTTPSPSCCCTSKTSFSLCPFTSRDS